MKSVADIIRTYGQREPNRIAVEFEGQSIPYGAIEERANQVANALRGAGLKPQQTVAFLDKNTPEYFEIAFGAAKARAISLGINWRLSPPRWRSSSRMRKFASCSSGRSILTPSRRSAPNCRKT